MRGQMLWTLDSNLLLLPAVVGKDKKITGHIWGHIGEEKSKELQKAMHLEVGKRGSLG